jgi:CBS domain-containing protein
MTVEAILKRKGRQVVTIAPEVSVAAAARRLNHDHIGALVVIQEGQAAGIISERDIIAAIARDGPVALERRVGDVMTWPVVTCTRSQPIKEIMAIMTRQRIRHIPVVEDGRLLGIVSIGDVVKHRLGELEMEAGVLHDLMIARS